MTSQAADDHSRKADCRGDSGAGRRRRRRRQQGGGGAAVVKAETAEIPGVGGRQEMVTSRHRIRRPHHTWPSRYVPAPWPSWAQCRVQRGIPRSSVVAVWHLSRPRAPPQTMQRGLLVTSPDTLLIRPYSVFFTGALRPAFYLLMSADHQPASVADPGFGQGRASLPKRAPGPGGPLKL